MTRPRVGRRPHRRLTPAEAQQIAATDTNRMLGLPQPGERLCGCGCNEPCRRTFLPGHDQRLKGHLGRLLIYGKRPVYRAAAAAALLARGWGYLGTREAWTEVAPVYRDPRDLRSVLPSVNISLATYVPMDANRIIHGHHACIAQVGVAPVVPIERAMAECVWSCPICTHTASFYERAERQLYAHWVLLDPTRIDETPQGGGPHVTVLDRTPPPPPPVPFQVTAVINQDALFETWLKHPAEVDAALDRALARDNVTTEAA